MKIKIEVIIENLIKTLEQNNYSIYELKEVLCDCNEVEDGDDYDIEEDDETKQLERYEERLKRITDLDDETEKEKELKKLLKDLKEKYQGNNPSKEIKKFNTKVRKLLDGLNRKKSKPFDMNK